MAQRHLLHVLLMGLDLIPCAPDALTATSQVPLTSPRIPRRLRPATFPTELIIFCPKPDLRLSHITGNDTAISFAEARTYSSLPTSVPSVDVQGCCAPYTSPWTCQASGWAPARLGVPLHWTPLQVPGCGMLFPPHPQDLLT